MRRNILTYFSAAPQQVNSVNLLDQIHQIELKVKQLL